MQMQIQIKTECSFAVKIYKSRQHQQVANARANDPRDQRIAQNRAENRNLECEETKCEISHREGAQMHLLDAFRPQHRSIRIHIHPDHRLTLPR